MPLNMHSNNRPKFLSFALKTLSASVASAVLLSSAHAAGLGKLTVLSALGQPLRAEIELTSVSPDELGSIVAKLAPADAFKQANIDFNPALLSLRFAVDQRGNRQFIRISSTQAVNEPFVDMLLEVASSSGRIVREYTFLLDPADLRTSPAQVNGTEVAAVSKPAATSTATSTATSVAAATESSAKPSKKPVKATKPEQPAPVEKPTASEKPATAESNAAASYEVKKGDTLGKIAAQTKVSGVSLDQMLAALYRANTNAFVGNNMNRLRSGQILNVPDAESVKAISQGEARSLVIAQSADFNGYRNKLAGQVEAASATKAPEIKQGASGKITSKVEQPATAADKSQDKLKLTKSMQGNTSASAMGMSNEEKIAKDKAIAEANARVKELERNINELNKVVELKNKALAEKAAKANAPTPVATPAATPVATPAPAKPSPTPTPTKASPVPTPAPPAATPVATPAPPAATPVATPAPPAATPVATPAPPAATPPKRQVVIAPPPPPEPSLMDTLMDNLLPIGGIAGLLAGGIGYFLYRRRKEAEQPKFESSMLNESGLQANSMFGQTGGQSVDTNNSVFNSNFAPSASQLDTNEVDPVAEADVYIAYGRDVQAEEILKEALRTQPERNAVRLKLLEIYASRKDTRAFEVQAGELYAITQGEGEDWAQAASLGMTIDPNNPMYAGGDAANNAKASTPLHASTEPLDDLDPEAMLVSTQQPRTPAPAPLEDDFNFDLPADAADQLSSLDLDLSPASASPIVPEEDFDFGINEPAPAPAPAPAPSLPPEPVEEEHILDFDLGGLTFKPTPPAAPAAPIMPAADLAELDKMMDGDLDMGFNETAKFSPSEMPRDLSNEAPVALPAAEEDLDLSDFNLEASALPEMDMDFGIAPAAPAPAPAAPEIDDMKFDLDDMDFGIAEPDPDATIVARSQSSPAEAPVAPVAPVAPAAPSLPDLDLPPVPSEDDEFAAMLADLPDLDDSLMATEVSDLPDLPSVPAMESASLPAAPIANDFDLSGIDLDLKSATDGTAPELGALDDLDDLSDLNDGDEISSVQVEMDTKLDLAVAYQEIGDKEGARELIDEVIKGGSPDQVEKAKAMRAKLA